MLAGRSVLVLCLLLSLAACGSDSEPEEADAPSSSTTSEVREVATPTALRTVAGPFEPSQALADDVQLSAAAFGDGVLLATTDADARSTFYAGDVATGAWQSVDGIPEGDEQFLSRAGQGFYRIELVEVDDGVVVLGTRCPRFNLTEEESTPCADPGQFEGWKLDVDGTEWRKIVAFDLDDVIDHAWAETKPLGVVGGDAVVAWYPSDSEGVVARIDLDGGDAKVVGPLPNDHNVHVFCATGAGVVAGASLKSTVPDDAAAQADPARRVLSTMTEDGTWTHHPRVNFDPVTGLDRLLCGADSVNVMIDDAATGMLRSVEVDTDGTIEPEQSLPRELSLGTHIPPCDFQVSFPPPQFEVGSGSDAPGVVRDFGWVTALDGGLGSDSANECTDPSISPYQVAALPALDGRPLIQTYEVDGGPLRVAAATRLPDGQIVSVVRRHVDQGTHTVELLVAE